LKVANAGKPKPKVDPCKQLSNSLGKKCNDTKDKEIKDMRRTRIGRMSMHKGTRRKTAKI